MKFPIDVEAWIQEFEEMYPGNSLGVRIFHTVLPLVNDAYEQGLKDGDPCGSGWQG